MSRPRASAPPPLRVRELAQLYQVHRVTVWRWIARGLVRVERLGPRTGVRVRPPQT